LVCFKDICQSVFARISMLAIACYWLILWDSLGKRTSWWLHWRSPARTLIGVPSVEESADGQTSLRYQLLE
jgi:hypothetical protein